MNCFKVAGRKTGFRMLIQCSQSSAMFLCVKLVRESETKLGVCFYVLLLCSWYLTDLKSTHVYVKL